MIIKRIDPMSFAKLNGVMYAAIGLIAGLFFALVGRGLGGGGMMGSFGMAAIIVLPIIYGVFGFVVTAIFAMIYNLVAGWVGGIKLEVE
jgi:hypothetical protein